MTAKSRCRLRIYSRLLFILIIYQSFTFAEAVAKNNDVRQLEFIGQLQPFFLAETKIENQREWIASSFQVVDQFLTSDVEDDSVDRNKMILDFLEDVSVRNADSDVRLAVSRVIEGYLLLSKNPQRSCDIFNKTLKFSKTNTDNLLVAKTYSGLAWCSNNLKDYDKAIQYLDTALRLPLADLKNEEVGIYLSKGWIEYFSRKPEKSCVAFQKVRDLSPESLYQKIQFRHGLSLCYKFQKNYDAALKEADGALALIPTMKFISLSVDIQTVRAWTNKYP